MGRSLGRLQGEVSRRAWAVWGAGRRRREVGILLQMQHQGRHCRVLNWVLCDLTCFQMAAEGMGCKGPDGMGGTRGRGKRKALQGQETWKPIFSVPQACPFLL